MSAGARALRRGHRALLLASLVALTAASWVWMFRMPGQHAAHGQAFALAATMWFVMMVAMMMPTVIPWILLFARIDGERRGGGGGAGLFVGGYLLVWLGYSLLAAVVQISLAGTPWLGGHDLRIPPVAGGVVLVTAGLFQWSPLKARCLRHCRSPLGYLLERWRDGPLGALSLGMRHGAFCVVCCWALMAVSFALGVMNLVWMAALTAMLCVEKIAPAGERLGRLFGLGLVAWGVRSLLG